MGQKPAKRAREARWRRRDDARRPSARRSRSSRVSSLARVLPARLTRVLVGAHPVVGKSDVLLAGARDGRRICLPRVRPSSHPRGLRFEPGSNQFLLHVKQKQRDCFVRAPGRPREAAKTRTHPVGNASALRPSRDFCFRAAAFVPHNRSTHRSGVFCTHSTVQKDAPAGSRTRS